MSPSENAPCLLRSLGKWSPETHLLGLKSKANGVTLDKASFNCCDGQGIQLDSSSPRSASQCSLMRRWSRFSSFLSQIGLEPNDSTNILFGHHSGDFTKNERDLWEKGLRNLQLFCRDNLDGLLRRTRGQIIDMSRYTWSVERGAATADGASGEASTPRLAMIVGAILIWHFETCVLPFRMGQARNNSGPGLPNFSMVPVSSWDALLDKSGAMHKVIMVDGVSELWHPNRLELIEGLISFASERRIPLWIFEDPVSDTTASPNSRTSDKSFRSGVNKRLSELRSRSAADWITAQGRSRLSEVCDVTERATKPSGIPPVV